jgi:hypothetical protein
MDAFIWILLILFWACFVWLGVIATIYVALKVNYRKYYKQEIEEISRKKLAREIMKEYIDSMNPPSHHG